MGSIQVVHNELFDKQLYGIKSFFFKWYLFLWKEIITYRLPVHIWPLVLLRLWLILKSIRIKALESDVVDFAICGPLWWYMHWTQLGRNNMYWFLGNMIACIQQKTNVWVGSPSPCAHHVYLDTVLITCTWAVKVKQKNKKIKNVPGNRRVTCARNNRSITIIAPGPVCTPVIHKRS